MSEYEYTEEEITYLLPKEFKGLSQKYIISMIKNEDVQKNWRPQVGDVIVGSTGNIFVISAKHALVEKMGGDMFFFGGGLCTRGDGCELNETYSYSMNESGDWYEYDEQVNLVVKPNLYHSSWKKFKFVPYPHETYDLIK